MTYFFFFVYSSFIFVIGLQLNLQAYDQHLNMILGDVEEIVTTVEIDDETYEEIVRVSLNQQKKKRNTLILLLSIVKC